MYILIFVGKRNISRHWETINVGKGDQSNHPGITFTIMNYNVLAQELITAHPYLYRSHIAEALDWKVRWRNLYEEIKHYKCDVRHFFFVLYKFVSKYSSISRDIPFKFYTFFWTRFLY